MEIDRERDQERDRMARRLSRAAELIHSVNYYADEINRLVDDGFRGWWHSYLAYRSAPLGPVGAPVVTATFYNFAPRMVERAVPGVWTIMSPERVLARRNELVEAALTRIFADGGHDDLIAEGADLAQTAVANLEPGARPLSAAVAGLRWPDGPAMRLWHACTIWREYRGDSHNIALAAAGVDGLECHLLMAAAGHGNQATISAIRGWTAEEWSAAAERLQARDLIDGDGGYTAEGDRFRTEIERSTDRLCGRPVETLGMTGSSRLYEIIGELGAHLTEAGEVPGVWPPPGVRR
ncbi:MAG: SCO6745 family protein [Acidimicrobiales bacterium]